MMLMLLKLPLIELIVIAVSLRFPMYFCMYCAQKSLGLGLELRVDPNPNMNFSHELFTVWSQVSGIESNIFFQYFGNVLLHPRRGQNKNLE